MTIAPEVVEEMATHFRSVVKSYPNITEKSDHFLREAHRIVALLPEPIDPDLIRARKIAADLVGDEAGADHPYVAAMRAGECDNDTRVRCTLAGIRAGRGA